MLSRAKEKQTWEDIDHYTTQLYDLMMRSGYVPSCILSIGRGGLIPGALLAYKFNVPQIEQQVIYAESYKADKTSRDPTIYWPKPEVIERLQKIERKLLIIDDLIDSGRTILAFRQKFPLAATAALIDKCLAHISVDFCPFYWNDAPWIEFPWES